MTNLPLEEEGFYVLPGVDAAVADYVDVGGGGVEDALRVEGRDGFALHGGGGGSGLEAVELAGVVVDEEVGAEDGFVAAEDDV